jgi:hypothetical protein
VRNFPEITPFPDMVVINPLSNKSKIRRMMKECNPDESVIDLSYKPEVNFCYFKPPRF